MVEHIFKYELNGRVDELLNNCDSLEVYLNNLRKLSEKAETDRFCQSGFQSFVEAAIRFKRILDDYRPVPSNEEDLFVHGTGSNVKGYRSSVYALYIADKDKDCPLTSNKNHISSFFANSMSHYDVSGNDKDTMYLFSNAKGVHENTYENFIASQNLDNVVVIFMREDIERIINGNKEFWSFFRNELKIPKVKTNSLPKKKKLRKFQRDAVKDCQKKNKGQIILPTGTGKSLIEAAVIEKAILKNSTAVCLIATPRIVLTYQLINEIFEHLTNRGVEAKYINLNSGRLDEDALKQMMSEAGLTVRDIPSTTDPKKLSAYNWEREQQNLPLIIGATYHSAPKILESDVKITTLICDEAHNLVNGVGRFSTRFKEDFHKIDCENKYSFTATPAYTATEQGTGMKNSELFGEQIFTRTPKEMMDAGEIVPPFVDIVTIPEYKVRKNKKMLETIDGSGGLQKENLEVSAMIVAECYMHHKDTIKSKSCSPDDIGAKMLVVCKGEQMFSNFLKKSEILKSFRQANPGVGIYGISSESGAYVDGEWLKPQGSSFKEKFMLKLKQLKDEQDVIIFHIDMIGEGIDVPGITGVLPFRDLGDIKSCQTLGRAMRLCPIDRGRLYSNKIKPLEFSKMVKPYAWVILPMCSWEASDMDRIVKIATDMRWRLDYMPFGNVNGSSFDGKLEQLRNDDHKFSDKTPEEMTIIHKVEETFFMSGDIVDIMINNPEAGNRISKKIIKTRDMFAELEREEQEAATK